MSFPALTVRENVQIAIEHGSRRQDSAGPQWSSAEELLAFVDLEGFADEVASVMPFGNLRRLGVAVALGGRRRNSCLTSRLRDSTKARVFNSFICFGALMNLEWGFASSITTLA
jgi:hypothetical protein